MARQFSHANGQLYLSSEEFQCLNTSCPPVEYDTTGMDWRGIKSFSIRDASWGYNLTCSLMSYAGC